MAGFFHDLGERAAPAFLKMRWLYRSFTGSPEERIQAERGMGRYLAYAFLQQAKRDPDTSVARRLNAMGSRMAPWLRNRAHRFRFYSVLLPEVNAFALPGGFIFVSGKLNQLCGNDEDALAFVLAHEMAHVVKEHAFNRMLASEAFSLLSRRALAGASFQQALQSLLLQLLRQGYSRRHELEADRFALRLQRAAGFDPAGGVRLLEYLRASAGEPAGSGAYFSSHPPFAQRILLARSVVSAPRG